MCCWLLRVIYLGVPIFHLFPYKLVKFRSMINFSIWYPIFTINYAYLQSIQLVENYYSLYHIMFMLLYPIYWINLTSWHLRHIRPNQISCQNTFHKFQIFLECVFVLFIIQVKYSHNYENQQLFWNLSKFLLTKPHAKLVLMEGSVLIWNPIFWRRVRPITNIMFASIFLLWHKTKIEILATSSSSWLSLNLDHRV